MIDLCLWTGKLHTCQANDARHTQTLTLKDYIMTTEQIIQAMHQAKVYEAANMQARTGTIDNLSMLVAVATGLALRHGELYDVFNALIAD